LTPILSKKETRHRNSASFTQLLNLSRGETRPNTNVCSDYRHQNTN